MLRAFFVGSRLRKITSDGYSLLQVGGGGLLLGLPLIATGLPLGCLGMFLVLPAVLALGLGLIIVVSAEGWKHWLLRAPSTATVTRWLHESVAKLRGHSLARLSLSEAQVNVFNQPPIILTPILWAEGDIDPGDILYRFDAKKSFFSFYRVVIVHLASDTLGIYVCDFNFLRDVSLNDESLELSYQDVVTLGTKQVDSARTLPSGQKLQKEQTYSLTLSSGQAVQLGSTIPQLGRLLDEDDVPQSDTENAIAAIRVSIRDRKRALARRSRRSFSTL